MVGTAQRFCARATAEHLWNEARFQGHWAAALRRNVPLIAGAGEAGAAPAGLQHRQVLEQLTARQDYALTTVFFREIRYARDILRRLKSFDAAAGLTEEEDAALSQLCVDSGPVQAAPVVARLKRPPYFRRG
jgi:hypothetical protein